MDQPLRSRLAAIREKLRERARAPLPDPNSVGYHAPRTLDPPLSVGALEEFEAAHGVSLPEEYRAFLLELGDGGVGPPVLGLVRLGKVEPDAGPEALAGLSRPFPLTARWVWEDDQPWTPEKEQLRRRVFTDGSLLLGDSSCGGYWRLVVSGPERGQVWLMTDVGACHCAPRRSFLSWYERWLEGHDDWWAESP